MVYDWVVLFCSLYRQSGNELPQKKLERTKTIGDTSNRSGVVSNVVCDDFMQLERPLGAEQVSACLAAPRGAS